MRFLCVFLLYCFLSAITFITFISSFYYLYFFFFDMEHWSDTNKWLIDWLIVVAVDQRTSDIISWQRMRRSRSFDSTDRFNIGRYELLSVSPGFFLHISWAGWRIPLWGQQENDLRIASGWTVPRQMARRRRWAAWAHRRRNWVGRRELVRVVEQRRCRQSVARNIAIAKRQVAHG